MMLRREFPFFESGKLIRAMKMAPKPVQYKCARALLLMSFLTLVQMAFAQPGIELDGTVTEKETNRKLAGVDVKVFRSGAIYDAVSTLSNGKYAVSLEHGTDYMLLFTFEDLSERRVELKTSSIPEEYRDQPFYLKVEFLSPIFPTFLRPRAKLRHYLSPVMQLFWNPPVQLELLRRCIDISKVLVPRLMNVGLLIVQSEFCLGEL